MLPVYYEQGSGSAGQPVRGLPVRDVENRTSGSGLTVRVALDGRVEHPAEAKRAYGKILLMNASADSSDSKRRYTSEHP